LLFRIALNVSDSNNSEGIIYSSLRDSIFVLFFVPAFSVWRQAEGYLTVTLCSRGATVICLRLSNKFQVSVEVRVETKLQRISVELELFI
jgi:hypothetical protein